MKVSVTSIVKAHLATLRNLGEETISVVDILIFYASPAIAGVISWYGGITLSSEVYSASISIFAIFSALLFSVQVAMYGVFRSDRKLTGDDILDRDELKTAEDTRQLLREINANVSYLILVSCIAVTILLIFFAAPIPETIEASILIALYLHFLLTVAMVLKRAHEVFDSEYAKPIKFDRKK
ncbi:hypothetical protein [Roseovarius sp. D22-M7]|uniref:hypothetical protein n=1 Tax=Roseovarius sp. D22-M7 TaxID=3127116 RepID=UPI00300FD4E5